MAVTNFAALTSEQLTVWKRDVWRAARHYQFMNRFTGTGNDSMIQRITELTESEKGARAVITLVAAVPAPANEAPIARKASLFQLQSTEPPPRSSPADSRESSHFPRSGAGQ